MWGFKNKSYSKKRLEKWSDSGKFEKLIKVLKDGNDISKVRAMDLLRFHNYIIVKNALNEALDEKKKFLALKAAESITYMGANEEELVKIEQVRKKWEKEEITDKEN